MNLFHENNPVIRFLTGISNLIILNWLFLLCCVPIVTVGPALTGMHRVLLAMHQGEDPSVVKCFFRGVKENFGKAMALWLVILLLGIALAVDFFVVPPILSSTIWLMALPAATLMGLLLLTELVYAFPLLARYQGSVFTIAKNAVLLGIGNLPNTLIAFAVTLAVPYICLHFPTAIPMLLLLSLFVLFSGVCWLCDWFVSRSFQKVISKP